MGLLVKYGHTLMGALFCAVNWGCSGCYWAGSPASSFCTTRQHVGQLDRHRDGQIGTEGGGWGTHTYPSTDLFTPLRILGRMELT